MLLNRKLAIVTNTSLSQIEAWLSAVEIKRSQVRIHGEDDISLNLSH